MIKFSSLVSLFSFGLYFPILGGFAFKSDKYENNFLINVNNDYHKVVMSKDSFKKLKLKNHDFFTFFSKNNEEYRMKIVDIRSYAKTKELILENKNSEYLKDRQQFKTISYFLEKKTLWSDMLG